MIFEYNIHTGNSNSRSYCPELPYSDEHHTVVRYNVAAECVVKIRL